MKKTAPANGHTNPDYLEWAIDGRARTQHAAWRLYGSFLEHPTKFKSSLNREASDLLGIAFSLWRALFLAENASDAEMRHQDALSFLDKMLAENSITFAHDRATSAWSFTFYYSDALLRLERMAEKWPSIKSATLVPVGKPNTRKKKWTLLQDGFERGIDCFEGALKEKSQVKATSQAKKASPPGRRRGNKHHPARN